MVAGMAIGCKSIPRQSLENMLLMNLAKLYNLDIVSYLTITRDIQ